MRDQFFPKRPVYSGRFFLCLREILSPLRSIITSAAPDLECASMGKGITAEKTGNVV